MDTIDLTIKPIDDVKVRNDNEPKVIPTHPFSMSLVAPKASGKTTLLANLLTRPEFYKSTFERIIILCPTAHADEKYQHIMEQDILFRRKGTKAEAQYDKDDKDKYKINKADLVTDPDKFVTFLKKLRSDYTEIFEKEGKKSLPRTLLLLDDVLGLDILRNRTLVNYIANTRHLNTSVIISVQRYNSIPKTIRLNATYLIVYPVYDVTEIKTIYEETGSKFTYKEFVEIVNELFDRPERSFLAFNNQNRPSHRLIDSFKYFILKN